jgi:glycosyltransferase involved in cell wall biosynthesis
MMDFTIITPVYNGEKYIRETIDSIINCVEGISAEIIVINDGSTDQTQKILENYGAQILLLNQVNAGEANAVNKGISSASGRFSLVVSADDPLLSKDLFSRALKVFNENPSCVVVYPDWQMIDENGEVLLEKECDEFSFKKMLGEFNCIPGPGAVFSTTIAKKIHGRNPEYRFTSDYDFWLRMALHGDFIRIPRILAQWRQHPESTSIGQRGSSMAAERIAVIENYLDQHPQSKELSRQAMASAYYNAAILSFFNPALPGRKWLLRGFYLRKGWITGSRVRIVAYILLSPISRYLYQILKTLGITKKLRHK